MSTPTFGWPIPALTGAADIATTFAAPMNAIDTTMASVQTAANAVKAVAHARFTATAGLAIPATTFTTIPLNATVDASASPPYTLASNVVTVSQAGVYQLSGAVSATLSTFCLRISVGTNVVTQTAIGAGGSLTTDVSRTVRLTAGQTVKMEIYATVGLTVTADSAMSPTSLTITRIGL